LCEHLNWLTPGGLPKTTACTKRLNRLEEQHLIRLPAKQKRAGHPGRCAQSVSKEAGLKPPRPPTPSNCKTRFESQEQESCARHEAVTGLVQLMRQPLPVLLKRLGWIPDPRNPRNPNKLKYKLTVLMIYGILVFVFQ
jgi:hypothetical protein